MNLSTLTSRVTSWLSPTPVVIEAQTPQELVETGLISMREVSEWLSANAEQFGIAPGTSAADIELELEDRGYVKGFRPTEESRRPKSGIDVIDEAFTQADIELALDDRGWLVGGKRMAGELDPMSRITQVNRGRYYWLRDPLAKQSVRLWTDYSLGDTALTYVCEDEKVQASLDKFMKDRRNRKITTRAGQRRLSQRLLIDGEIFFAVFDDGTIRTFDCLQITDIITDPDDEDTVLAYKRVTAPPDGKNPKILYYQPWDYVKSKTPLVDPANKQTFAFAKNVVMYHLAFDALEKRGNGLLSCCSDWSKEHRRFMTARVGITQALSKFAFKMTVKGGQRQINSIRAKAESTFANTGLTGGTEKHPVTAPGGTWLQNEGAQLEAMPRTTGAGDAKADADGLKLMMSAGTGIMLHYYGDPSTGNLATATAMELPMLKMFASYQVYWRDAWRDLFSIVLKEDPNAEPADITITLPEILEDDLQTVSACLTSVVAAFPEAKVPAVLRTVLSSMNVPNLDEVMDAIEDQKELNDAQAVKDAATASKTAIAVAKASGGKPVAPAVPGAPNTTEAERYDRLTAALGRLVEVMK